MRTMGRMMDRSWSSLAEASRARGADARMRRWAVQASMVGTVLFVACGWVGGGAAPTPTLLPPVPSPSPSPSGIQIPSASIAPSPSPSPSPSPVAGGGDSYTVGEGDTLASIAGRFYGDETQWRRIYDANRQAIGENPDAVRIGTVLRIPPRQ